MCVETPQKMYKKRSKLSHCVPDLIIIYFRFEFLCSQMRL